MWQITTPALEHRPWWPDTAGISMRLAIAIVVAFV
jgi:hypothetical protein